MVNQEIERKYLVDLNFRSFVSKTEYIKQGYLSTDPDRTVRIRITENRGFITIKGKSSKDGLVRMEWEKEISVEEAETLISLALPTVIAKYRHLVNYKNQEFTIDEFLEENKGLLLAEIELDDIDQLVDLPPFILSEVTGDVRFYNSHLSKNPYTHWKD